MRRPVLALGVTLLCLVAVSKCTKSNPRQAGAAPTPEPTIVRVAVTPSQAPARDVEPTWTPDPELVYFIPTTTPTAPPSPTRRPTLDVSSIPSLARPMLGRPGAGDTAGMGRLELDQPEFKYPLYIERLVGIISMNYLRPSSSVQTRPVVRFEIERDGTITHARLVTSSGVSVVDRAALRAVIQSSPLPPLPPEYRGTRLGVQVDFE